MAIVTKRLCHGVLTDSNATLYTVPTGGKAIVKSLALCNAGAAAVTVTLKLGGVALYSEYSIDSKETVVIGQLDQVLDSAELIEGLASAATSISYHISGKEIT